MRPEDLKCKNPKEKELFFGSITALEIAIDKIDEHIKTVRLPNNSPYQEIYEQGQRHAKEVVELILKAFKEGAEKGV